MDRPKALTMQYMVLFSHRTVQLPAGKWAACSDFSPGHPRHPPLRGTQAWPASGRVILLNTLAQFWILQYSRSQGEGSWGRTLVHTLSPFVSRTPDTRPHCSASAFWDPSRRVSVECATRDDTVAFTILQALEPC